MTCKREFPIEMIRAGDTLLVELLAVDGREERVHVTEVTDNAIWFGDTGMTWRRFRADFGLVGIERNGEAIKHPTEEL